MAARIKKQPASTKEVVMPQTSKPEGEEGLAASSEGGILKKLTKKPVVKTTRVKKIIKLKAKAKRESKKKANLKINPKNFARVLMENGKDPQPKKVLLKNGTEEVIKRKRAPKKIAIKKETEEESPPVLEPIFPQEENEIKVPKKRGRKKIPILIDMKKIKSEPSEQQPEGSGQDALEALPSLVNVLPKVRRKPGRQPRKPKLVIPPIEHMTELPLLIDSTKVKQEPEEMNSGDVSCIPPLLPKVKRVRKKQHLDKNIELVKKTLIKKENIENTLSKLDPADVKVIDRLDLNVRKFKTEVPKEKRRHSIEKFPIEQSATDEDLMPQLSVFNLLPRSISPKTSKRGGKMGNKRASPYTTRLDAPSRILRNGRYRNLKDIVLLEGLEGPKRRKRVHSDMSGGETASKLSGYESDSSFSDLASIHDSEKESETLKPNIKELDNMLIDSSTNCGSDLDKPNCSTEKQLIDTNSNVCAAMKNYTEMRIDENLTEDAPSQKVPEKGVLLDIMKQTFNDICGEKSLSKVETPCSSVEVNKKVLEEKTVAIMPVEDVLSLKNMTEEEELRQLLEQTEPDVKNNLNDDAGNILKAQDEFEEQAAIKNMVQDCINSIETLSQVASTTATPGISLKEESTPENKEDDIPVIDNMSTAILEPPPNHEHLDPPLLESSILEPESSSIKRLVMDDPNIGIAVREKDNIVFFSIDEAAEADEHVDCTDEVIQNVEIISKDDEIINTIDEENELEANETNTDEGIINNADEETKVDDNEKICYDQIESVSKVNDDQNQPKIRSEDISDIVEETKDDAPQVPEQELIEEMTTQSIEDTAEVKPVEEQENNEKDTNKNELLTEHLEPCAEPTMECVPFIPVIKDSSEIPSNEVVMPVIVSVETVKEKCSDEECAREIDMDEQYKKPLEFLEDEIVKPTTESNCDKPGVSGEMMEKALIQTVEQPEESPEEIAHKESILNALGLQSIKGEKESSTSKKKSKVSASKAAGYTGTLKTVIKINKKKGKNPLKMTLQKSKSKHEDGTEAEEGYKIMKEGGSTSWKHSNTSDSAEGSSDHTSDGEQSGPHDKPQPEKSLIVPEKASSFSIHPGRLCKDECSYCFGKFGLFDTPCHIAQIKSVDRQNKILAAESHLTRDSCLCDACYRHVDRKSNSPSYINKSLKRNSLVAPGPRQNHCHVLGCNNVSSNILRRKWIIKMRKSICQVINIDLDNPGLHSIPICDEHFSKLEHLMICAMCKRRLARNHIHYLGPEVQELNEALKDEGILINLSDKPVVCKLCKCFASIILKDPEERLENCRNFFIEYKKRLLHFNDIIPMDSTAADEPLVIPTRTEKLKEAECGKRKKRSRNSSNETDHSKDDENDDHDNIEGSRKRVASSDTNLSRSANQSRAQSPEGDEYSGVDYNTLIPAIAMECPSDSENKKDGKIAAKTVTKTETVTKASDALRTYKSKNDLAAQRLGQNPSISLKPNYGTKSDSWQDERSSKLITNPSISVRQLFPGEEELGLAGDIDFKNVLGRTPEGWEKCTSVIQYDEETKLLWQELQKPYGSKSSFLRHLILLEKYFRNGDLVLSPTASHHAVNYRESVQNRLRAYDNIPSKTSNVQPPSMVQFNKIHRTSGGVMIQNSTNGLAPITISQVGESEIQSSRTPITVHQLRQPPLYPTSTMLQNLARNRPNAPPGLISINQRPQGPSNVRAQASQKIKFPITKNWRPNLIPIDPNKKHERKPGLVQVISGGKPYHITLEDYKKMCAIKRSFEAKQKKLQEQQILSKQQSPVMLSQGSVLKTVVPKKSLFIGKTSGGTVIEGKPLSLVPISTASSTITSESTESILEKLDKTVERLGQNQDSPSIMAYALDKNPAIQIIPRIPKSLTITSQTVTKTGPPSPVLCITPRTSSNGSSSNDNSSGQP
ncbi:uncharacterized protein LOC126740870 isoform X2 [Anthonomus grandis grandis]|uniref:uncharacterized protein LOC126740870 isoform X2 n=1 Tax=Anthonomus grandis grandis TaxID=2921223 RepID=UPI00216674C9|nr:uncharacterized protein LOC126740870 isoform X2 [Anthonomus grandis grandis]